MSPGSGRGTEIAECARSRARSGNVARPAAHVARVLRPAPADWRARPTSFGSGLALLVLFLRLFRRQVFRGDLELFRFAHVDAAGAAAGGRRGRRFADRLEDPAGGLGELAVAGAAR